MVAVPVFGDVRMLTVEEYLRFHGRRFGMMMALLGRHLPARVGRSLDIGGAGDLLNLACFVRDHYGAEAYSVDLGDDVGRARDKGLLCHECDVDRQPLPFEDGFFDLVTFASVIEHLYNPHLVLEEMARVLKPGGYLMIEAPNAVSMGRRIDVLKGRNPFRFFHQYNTAASKEQMLICSLFYTPEEVRQLLDPWFDLCERAYGLHTPKLSWPKMLVHETLVRLFPRMSDCFALMMRRKGN